MKEQNRKSKQSLMEAKAQIKSEEAAEENSEKKNIATQATKQLNQGKAAMQKLAEANAAAAAAQRKRERPKETVRQKNKRKMKLGQAKFTVKSNRECPDIYRPPE